MTSTEKLIDRVFDNLTNALVDLAILRAADPAADVDQQAIQTIIRLLHELTEKDTI